MADELPNPATFQQLIDAGILEIGDGYRAKNSELGEGGPIFLRAGHVSDSAIDFQGVENFRGELAEKVQSKLARPGDTIVTTKGNSTGRTSYVRPEMPEFVYSPHLSYWRSLNHGRLSPRYLRYWSRAPEFANQLRGMMVSTDMAPYLSLTDQRRLSITLLSSGDQSRVGDILGSLDDNIELNRRMNGILEGMARAIFKAWFVDFEPVKAKAAGATRFPGMPQPVFNQLPVALVDSEIGEIPDGWEVGPILSRADLLSGGTPKTSVDEYWGGSIQWASAKDVSQCGDAFLISTERTITEKGLAESATKLIQPFSTVVVARGATTGRLTMFGSPIAMNQTCYALRSKIDDHFFLYCHARNFMESLVNAAHGSVFDTITTSTFQSTPVLIPDCKLCQAFNDQVSPLFNLVLANLREASLLTQVRDTLLPKLISGELAVPAPKGGGDGE